MFLFFILFEYICAQESNQFYSQVSYKFEVSIPIKNATSYYRIIRYFNNGKMSSSEIARLDASQKTETYLVLPNPTQGEIKIIGTSISPKINEWKVLGTDGREVLRSESNLNVSEVKLDVSKLSNGNYILILQNVKGETSIVKFTRN